MKLKTIFQAMKDIVFIILLISICTVLVNPNFWMLVFSKYPPFLGYKK
jgi:hypothetical protein